MLLEAAHHLGGVERRAPRPREHLRVDVAVRPPEHRVELPIREVEGVDEGDRVATEGAALLATALGAPRPNPAHGRTTVDVTLAQAGRVTLRVVDVLGREVARLLDAAPRAAGTHSVTWRTGDLGSGTYLLVLEGPEGRATRPVVVVR